MPKGSCGSGSRALAYLICRPSRFRKPSHQLRGEGRSLQTCNHHRNAIKSFVKWLYETHRIRENILRGVAGFNVKEDPRHERRTVSLGRAASDH